MPGNHVWPPMSYTSTVLYLTQISLSLQMRSIILLLSCMILGDIPSVLPRTGHVTQAMTMLDIQSSSLRLRELLATLLRTCNVAQMR